MWAAEPQAPVGRTLTGVLVGPRVAVFDTARDSCEQIDIPDEQARAFRDYKGTIHLVASHSVMRQNLGATLESVKHTCQVTFRSPHDPDPAHFNDYSWLDAFYTLDGRKVVALAHMEYHGWEHRMCSTSQDTSACWYNVDTFFLSEDGGYHFTSPKAPENFVLGLPYKYEVNRGPEGYSVDTNIIKVGEWYFAMTTDWPWPPTCNPNQVPNTCLVQFGGAPIRTTNILDPSSWRGWDGKDFDVVFVDPYRGPVAHPEEHIFKPVPYMYYVNGVYYHEAAHRFVAVLFDPWNDAYGPPGFYLSTSTDMVNWSKPTMVIAQSQLLAKEPKGNWTYGYFSLVDPNSKDPNYGTITDNPYVYYVRSDANHGPYVRVLFRQRIKLSWK